MATKSNSLVNTGSASIAHSGLLGEAGLVEAAKKGHHAAFGELYARHSQHIFRATFRVTRNREDAEDALQDSFLSAWVHVGSFDGRSSFSTWLTRIAINCALMKLRKLRACPEILLEGPGDGGEDFAPYESADPHPNPEQQFAQRQRQRIIAGAVGRLRPTLRQVIEMQRQKESSIKETARSLRISIPAAKSRLRRAQAALRCMPALRAMRERRVARAA
jgi:RNA polymerase sigma factor (sigma-70 family)